MTHSKTGLGHPEVIDLVAEGADSDAFILVLVEEDEWDGSRDRLVRLQTKLNNYLKFALDGPLLKQYPDSAGKRVEIRFYSRCPLDEGAVDFLNRLVSLIEQEGITFCHAPWPERPEA